MKTFIAAALTLICLVSTCMLLIIMVTPTTPTVYAFLVHLFLLAVASSSGLGMYVLTEEHE